MDLVQVTKLVILSVLSNTDPKGVDKIIPYPAVPQEVGLLSTRRISRLFGRIVKSRESCVKNANELSAKA
jgi:hypothetical protein